MKIKFNDKIFTLKNIENESLEKSELFESEIHSFDWDISVKGLDVDEFKNGLEKSEEGGVYSLDNDDNIIKEYKVSSKGCSYLGNMPKEETLYNYSLHFEEVVDIKLEALEICDLMLNPYEVEQNYDNGITMRASVRVNEDELNKIREIQYRNDYFSVIRHGISEKRISMRFGKNVWSEHEGMYKVKLILIEECYDSDNNYRASYDPELPNMKRMLAYQKDLNDRLITLLLSKGIVSEEEIENIRVQAKNNYNETNELFYKVKDIDKY